MGNVLSSEPPVMGRRITHVPYERWDISTMPLSSDVFLISTVLKENIRTIIMADVNYVPIFAPRAMNRHATHVSKPLNYRTRAVCLNAPLASSIMMANALHAMMIVSHVKDH